MKVYKIADLRVALDCWERTMENAEKYYIDDNDKNVDIVVKTDIEKGRRELKNTEKYTDDVFAYLYEGYQFYKELSNRFNGMRLHSSAVVVDGDAYLFSAPSGTGKSTHTSLWLKLFGERAYILNDDKPAIRVLEDGVYAYGTPWSGKHDISVNTKAKLKGICFIERSETNWIERIDPKDAVTKLYHQTTKRLQRDEVLKLLEIIEKVALAVPVYKMGCTPTIDAAKMAYDTISNG